MSQRCLINDSTELGAACIAIVMLRLATYLLWQLQGLNLVSKDQQEFLRGIYGDNTTSNKEESHEVDDSTEVDGADDDNNANHTENTTTYTGQSNQRAPNNATGGSQQRSRLTNSNSSATPLLSEIRHVSICSFCEQFANIRQP